MPHKLRRVSGKDLIRHLLKEGLSILRQNSSHVRLEKITSISSYRITVPLHKEIDRGTLKSIVRSLEKCLSSEKIREIFYTK
mgnify:CR=1 FL=1